ncbi:MAG TPA: BrnT family toxin [Thermoanaerobaculia bacterium]|jgi:hypothetical protein|nr:BrnT family toxin [Thermoanaerobaculia bacterium]
MKRDPLGECTGFDWNDDNLEKNWEKYPRCILGMRGSVSQQAAGREAGPAALPNRAALLPLGRTEDGRLLFVAFTVRKKLIRPISFRDMTAKERRTYEFYAKKDSEVQ